MTVVIISAAFFGLLIWYALFGRTWLKEASWAKGFFAAIEPIEILLFKKSETILLGRLMWVGSLLVSLYDGLALFASSLDLTPVTTRVFDILHVPQDMRGLAVSALLTGIGLAINWLRAKTSKPLELVAVADKDVTPRAAEAIAMADATKTEAVQVVATEAAKAA